jgi:signal transduction histidine kinase
VREILQWHSGKVTVESEPKKGTRVETWWPLTLEEKK